MHDKINLNHFDCSQVEFLSGFDSELLHINYDDCFGARLESNLTRPEKHEGKRRESAEKKRGMKDEVCCFHLWKRYKNILFSLTYCTWTHVGLPAKFSCVRDLRFRLHHSLFAHLLPLTCEAQGRLQHTLVGCALTNLFQRLRNQL